MVQIEKTDTFIEHDIYINGTKIGEVELNPEKHEIERLVIFEPYQGNGYGTEVVKSLTSHEQEIPHLYRWWDELRITRYFLDFCIS